MDTRYSPEQLELRSATAALLADLGPRTVADLDDDGRRARLSKAAESAGWYDLRGPGDDDGPLASGVEIAIVARELGRAAADTPFFGPVTAADLARQARLPGGAGVTSVVLHATLRDFAVRPGDVAEAVAVDCAGAARALMLLDDTLVDVAVGTPAPATDLTRALAPVATGETMDAREGALIAAEAVERSRALALTITINDLIGAMEGALDTTCTYAQERQQYGVAIGSFQAVQHLLAEARVLVEGAISVAEYAAWAVDALPPEDALDAGSVAKAYCARAARTVCETAIQVHGGIGNTWECFVHVYLRRVLLSSALLGDEGHHLRALRAADWETSVDFDDAPEEAAFRSRIRAWLAEHNPGLPASSTDDEYWARQAEWHCALFDAGFFALTWPRQYGGHELPPVYEVIVDEELAAAGAPPKPSLGYLIQGITRHASAEVCERFLPALISGRDRWCQGFSEPDAGSDLASLRTRAVLDGDEYVIDGHKIWTSYSDVADWCMLLARTDPSVPKHKGISAFAVPMHQPGIEQRPLKMINGVTSEFGQVLFDGVRVPAANMIGAPGEGWALAMTVVSHEREPTELGYVARYSKLVNQLEATVRSHPDRYRPDQIEALGRAYVESEMLRLHVRRRLSERLDGVKHGPEGSIDKLLMTTVEQAVGHAALAVGDTTPVRDGDDTWLKVYLYSRAQSVMGGTSQIQKNIIATRILGLPTS